MALKFTGAVDEAESALTASWQLNAELGDHVQSAYVAVELAQIGIARMLVGGRSRHDVRRLARDAARTFERAGNRHGLGMALAALGGQAMVTRRSGEAAKAYERARVIFHELGDVLAEASTLKTLSMVRLRQDRIEDALDAIQAAGELFRGLGNLTEAAVCASQEASFHIVRGDSERAIAVAKAALASLPPDAPQAIRLQLTTKLLKAYIAGGHTDEVARLEPEALQLVRSFPDPAIGAFGMVDIASGHFIGGDVTRAVRLAREGLQHAPPGHEARAALEEIVQQADPRRRPRLARWRRRPRA
jgi:hypothetical protein